MKTTRWIFALVLAWSCAGSAFAAADKAPEPEDESTIEKRIECLQRNFAKFVPVQFHKGTNGEAAVQFLPVKTNVFECEGTYYCGFKFTVPEWRDGDFEWFYLLAKTDANKDFTSPTLHWFIVPEKGRSQGFQYFQRSDLSRYARLKTQFPHTQKVTVQDLDQDRLIPGKTYGIWFGFKERDLPDIAFAMTISSERGEKEFGVLPLR
jgi:hypothetical protein